MEVSGIPLHAPQISKMRLNSIIVSILAVVIGSTTISALPASQLRRDGTGTCINQSSGNIYVEFENIDVEKGSSFMVRIGSLNTGNIAGSFGGASSVVVDQTSGDIYVTFDNIDVAPGGHVRLNIGSINTGNVAIVKSKAKQLRKPARPTPKPVPFRFSKIAGAASTTE